MPKARKRKVSVTANLDSLSSSSKHGSALIRRFHVLLKQQAHLQTRPTCAEVVQALAAVESEIEDMGGLCAYQRMSSIGQGKDRGGGSEKVLISWLKELGTHDRKGKGKVRLLEVGALKPNNYQSCSSWMEVVPIDIRSRHPTITEQDFLLMDSNEHKECWDVISLSLVVNFVPDAQDRGRMLTLAHHMLRLDGLLFLALPLPCVTNSRYLTFEHLRGLMEAIGFEQIRDRWKEHGKMAYWLFRKRRLTPHSESKDKADRYDKKLVLCGGNRNNFCILLKN